MGLSALSGIQQRRKVSRQVVRANTAVVVVGTYLRSKRPARVCTQSTRVFEVDYVAVIDRSVVLIAERNYA